MKPATTKTSERRHENKAKRTRHGSANQQATLAMRRPLPYSMMVISGREEWHAGIIAKAFVEEWRRKEPKMYKQMGRRHKDMNVFVRGSCAQCSGTLPSQLPCRAKLNFTRSGGLAVKFVNVAAAIARQ